MTGARSSLGRRLRQIRKSRGITGPELARKMEYNQSGISKIENGIIIPTREFVQKYAAAVGIGKAEAAELLELSDLFLHEFHKWDSERYGTAARLQEIVRKREARAFDIRGFNWSLIPGLLQTEQYARAVFHTLGERGDQEREKAVAGRIKRQAWLDDPRRKFTTVIPENALRSSLVHGEILSNQLQSLIRLNQKDNIEINILPLGAKLLCHPMNSFVIYDGRTVTIETQSLQSVLWEENDVDLYSRVFGLLLASSLRKEMANSFLRTLIANLENT
jgi:transcriptional regulator with XRE-family HTH domain